jgi:hypothetical protein
MAANLKIKVIQTSDSETGYKTLLDVNRKINEEYCRKMGYEYLAYYGIKRGYYPWQATFNRIYLMEDELDRKAVDWVLYIDADAVVADMGRRLEDIIFEGNNVNMAFIFCKGCADELYDINAGVFFMNVNGAFARPVISTWKSLFESICSQRILYLAKQPWSLAAGQLLIQDQSLLEYVFRMYNNFGVLSAFLKTYMGSDANKFNYDGTFIQQNIRPHQGRNGTDIDNRIAVAKHHAMSILARFGYDGSLYFPEFQDFLNEISRQREEYEAHNRLDNEDAPHVEAVAPISQPQEEVRQVEAPPQQVEAPPRQVEAPPQQVEAPPRQVEAPPQQVEAPPRQVEALPQQVETPPPPTVIPNPPVLFPEPQIPVAPRPSPMSMAATFIG